MFYGIFPRNPPQTPLSACLWLISGIFGMLIIIIRFPLAVPEGNGGGVLRFFAENPVRGGSAIVRFGEKS